MFDLIPLQYLLMLPAFLVVLTVIVFVHEMGHYLVARWNGIAIHTFSLGFGPEVVGFNDRAGTRWRISAVPLGGYVRFVGDMNPAGQTDPDIEDKIDPALRPRLFVVVIGLRAVTQRPQRYLLFAHRQSVRKFRAWRQATSLPLPIHPAVWRVAAGGRRCRSRARSHADSALRVVIHDEGVLHDPQLTQDRPESDVLRVRQIGVAAGFVAVSAISGIRWLTYAKSARNMRR